jgi:hypothetical protein
MSNPFYYGNPVPPKQFLGRRRELRRIIGRIKNQAQSTALVGEPRTGKTSLLQYLAAPEFRTKHYGAEGKQYLFSYLDAQTLGTKFSQEAFWKYVLQPLEDKIESGSPLDEAYTMCQENHFGAFVLERLLAQVRSDGWRLIVMLDEFNDLLHHPILNTAEFFGSLRSLATRSRSALALIVATPRSLTDLTTDTEQFSRAGSPYFNFMPEVTMGPLSLRDISQLFKTTSGERFSAKDRQFVSEIAGGHPYLVQAAASALWEIYDDGERDPVRRWRHAGESLYDEVAMTLGNTWRQWPAAMRQAFTSVALAHIPTLLGEQEFMVERFIRDMKDFGPELRELKKRGFTEEDEAVPGGWRVRPGAFLWWLADELTRTVRSEDAFEEWLRAEVVEGPLTRKERQQLGKVARETIDLVQGGVTALISAAAEGVGAGLASRPYA